MAWVRTVRDEEAEGLLKKIYDGALKRAGRIYQILRLQSLRPKTLRAMMELYTASTVAPSKLTRAQREMIAVVVSSANRCHY